MEELILFLMTFIVLFVLYQLFLINPRKKKRDDKRELIEIRYLVSKYSLDLDKISYNQLLQICAITSCLDISIVVTILSHINNFILELLIGFVTILVLIFISFHIVYLFYKKKGMIKSGKHK